MNRNIMIAIAAVAVIVVAAAAVVVLAGNGSSTEYTVTLNKGDNCDSIDNYSGSFKVKSGTELKVEQNELTIGNTTYVANGTDSTYTFNGWNVDSGTITSDLSLTASFSAAAYTLTITVGDNCTVSGYDGPVSIAKGATVTVDGNTLTIGSTSWTASYSGTKTNHEFNGWGITSGTVTGNIAVTPSYTEYEDEYTLELNTGDFCYQIEGYHDIVTVPYGTQLSVDGITLKVGDDLLFTPLSYDPDPGEVYLFAGWDLPSETMTSDMFLTANFEVYASTYELTLTKDDETCGEITNYTGPITVQTGSVITVDGTKLTVEGTTYTAVSSDESTYPIFLGWGIQNGTVMKKDYNLTASFSDESYDFTIVCVSGTPEAYTIVSDGKDGYTVTFAPTEDSEYAIYGELTGNIEVSAGDYDFKLDLGYDGKDFTLNAANLAPIVFSSVQDATISVPSGLTQTIKDTRAAVSSTSADKVACVYAKGDLDVQGNGILNITSANNNGIRSTADLYVKNLTLSVTSVDNSLKGDDSVTVYSGSVTLNATKGEGIKTDTYTSSKTSVHQGDVIIGSSTTSPVVTITAYHDGIDAAYDVKIYSGTVSITDTTKVGTSSTDSVKGIKAHNTVSISGGSITVTSYQDCIHSNNTNQAGTSTQGSVEISGGTLVLASSICDGLCSEGTMTITGGNITVSCGDEGVDQTGAFAMSAGTLKVTKAGNDGIKSDKSITISGSATVNITATDDGINAPSISISGGTVTVSVGTSSGNHGIMASTATSSTLTISGGTVTVSKSYEGIQASKLTVSGGTTMVTSTDDGINGPNSSSTMTFSKGDIYVHAGGDGIDCNGTGSKCITFSGANVIVVSTSGGNSALDVDGTYSYTGGVLALICPQGMTTEITGRCQESFSKVATQSTSISGTGWIKCIVGGTSKAVFYSDVSSSSNGGFGPGPSGQGLFAAYFGSASASISKESSQPDVSGMTQIGSAKAYYA